MLTRALHQTLPMVFVLGIVSAFFVPDAFAQRQRMAPEERAKMLKDSLTLSDEQTTKVTALYKEQQDAMMDAFQSGERGKAAEIMQKTDEKIAKLLNDDQKKKYEQMIKNRPQRGMGRRRAG